VGVFLAKTAPSWRAWPAAWRVACGGLGVGVLAATFAVCGPRLSPTDGLSLGLYTGLAAGFGLLLVGLESARLPRGLRWPVYQVAVLSYGVYLWHGLVVRVMERTHLSLGAAPLTFALFVAASLLPAWVTYLAVEKPCLRLRDRLLARQAAREEARGGAAAVRGG
jgi:peptidoglycan/LPS O-acetylase OafA/YrhL